MATVKELIEVDQVRPLSAGMDNTTCFVTGLLTSNWNFRFHTAVIIDHFCCIEVELIDIIVPDLEHQLSLQIMLEVLPIVDVISSVSLDKLPKHILIFFRQSSHIHCSLDFIEAGIVVGAYCAAVGVLADPETLSNLS